jgi:hypothetical protein
MVARSAKSLVSPVAALLLGSAAASAQATVDVENKYPNVGTIMVWRTDEGGRPVELRAFVSGTLIRDRVMITAGHFTAPVKALGTLPPDLRVFASFSPADAKNPETWIRVAALTTHPSMPHCPPPPQCDPTDDSLVAPLEPGIADLGLVFLADAPRGIEPARLAERGALQRSEGAEMTIVGYGTTTPRQRGEPPDTSVWDGKRRVRPTRLRRLVDEIWALWSIPSHVCSGDSGGAIFLSARADRAEELGGNVSDGGRDCRTHSNHVRLDTSAIQDWIDTAIREQTGSGTP